MATALRPVGHEERLTLVEPPRGAPHTPDHLRRGVRRGVQRLLLAERSRPGDPQQAAGDQGAERQLQDRRRPARAAARGSRELQKQAYETQARFARVALGRRPRAHAGPDPRCRAEAVRGGARPPRRRAEGHGATRSRSGSTEPFTQTISVARYAALLLALPLILYQAVRVPHTGVHAAASARSRYRSWRWSRCCSSRASPSATSSCSTRDRVPAELQRRQVRHPGPGQRLLQVRRSCSWGRSGSCSRSRWPSWPSPDWDRDRRSSCARAAATRSSASRSLAAVATPTPDPVTMTLAMAPARSCSTRRVSCWPVGSTA